MGIKNGPLVSEDSRAFPAAMRRLHRRVHGGGVGEASLPVGDGLRLHAIVFSAWTTTALAGVGTAVTCSSDLERVATGSSGSGGFGDDDPKAVANALFKKSKSQSDNSVSTPPGPVGVGLGT